MAGCTIVLLAATTTTDAVVAQVPQAFYPLITDLFDVTMNYGPVVLSGNPPPAQPNNGVCVNGVYLFSGGQDVSTPTITSLDPNDFQIDFEFQITALQPFNAPILIGGNLWRWVGFAVQSSGTFGILYNNSLYTWSTTVLATGTWYSATLKFEAGSLELFLDGIMIHTATVGPLNVGPNDFDFTSNNFSNGTNHNGCLRNLLISNDTTLGQTASATNYGTGCDGLVFAANGLPTIGNGAFEFLLQNVPVVSPIAFVAFGTAVVNPGVDLTPIGMAGCSSYTTFDLGLFGPTGVVGGVSMFPLPIPNSAALAGASVAGQGVSLSAATTLGLATSNGTSIVVGF